MARPLRIGVLGPRVADGDDEAAHRAWCGRLVFGVARGVIGRIVACVLPSAHVPQPWPRSHEITKKICFFFVCFSCLGVFVVSLLVAAPRDPFVLDQAAERWVERDLEEADAGRKNRSADRTDVRIELPQQRQRHLRHRWRVWCANTTSSGFHVFGASQPAPPVLLNPGYGTVILGQPLSAAFLDQSPAGDVGCAVAEHRRLRDRRRLPVVRRHGVSAADGDGGDCRGDDVRLVREEARITAVESRAMGIHVNFAPVADVNNNPRNPVINIAILRRGSGACRRARRRLHQGARDGGMIATIKHFPGHGDTDVDSHLGLPVVTFDRARLTRLELVPFKRRRAGRRRGHGRAHRAARARSRAVDAGDVQRAGAPPPVA